MRLIHLVKFSFGTNVLHNVPSEQVEYFSSFFSEYFDAKYTASNDIPDQAYKTIPVSYKTITQYPNILATKLFEFLHEQYNVVDEARQFVRADDLVVIDIKTNIRDTCLIHLANEIDLILSTDKNSTITI